MGGHAQLAVRTLRTVAALSSHDGGGLRRLGVGGWIAVVIAALKNPLMFLVLVRGLEELRLYWLRQRRLALGFAKVHGLIAGVDTELIQGCLVSVENLLSLGRVEKRTLFVRPVLEVLGGNEYLVREVLRASRECREKSHACLLPRWLASEERYSVLQSCLNNVSSIFGSSYVHFNAASGESLQAFKSTWYCLTVSTPTRVKEDQQGSKQQQRSRSSRRSSQSLITSKVQEMCKPAEPTKQPKATLRILLVNESELRRIADGKLRPPSWGFFNRRHAERYSMLEDFAWNFQTQLVKTSTNSHLVDPHNPLSSGQAYQAQPEGGSLMKRVSSQPNLSHDQLRPSGSLCQAGLSSAAVASAAGRLQMGWDAVSGERRSPCGQRILKSDGGCDDNCFLRLHVPHYVGGQQHPNAPTTVKGRRPSRLIDLNSDDSSMPRLTS